MKKLFITCVYCLTLAIDSAFADYDDCAYPFVITPRLGSQQFLMMLPIDESEAEHRNWIGRCYEINSKGTMKVLWKINWYTRASSLVLSQDGSGLVRKRLIARKNENKNEQLSGNEIFLEFYQNGILVRSHTLGSIVDVSKLRLASGSSVYPVADLSSERNSPKIITTIDDEVDEEAQLNKITQSLKRSEEVYVINTVQGERLFFRLANGDLLFRFRYKKHSYTRN